MTKKSNATLIAIITLLTTVVTSFTTIAVTYINAMSKTRAFNRQQILESRMNEPASSRSAHVRMSLKGFYMSTNNQQDETNE